MTEDGLKRSFDADGYVVARSLFDREETILLRDHFTRLRGAGAYPGDVVGVDPASDDPLKKYPRMIHMHRWDDVALHWLLEPRLARSLTTLLGGIEPFAVQTMLYGSLVHGSKPNRSSRFRRALIGHYVEGDARECSLWYHPALRLDGSVVELEQNAGGGPCGEWVETDGSTVIELTAYQADPRSGE